jgi:hypothetical protein
MKKTFSSLTLLLGVVVACTPTPPPLTVSLTQPSTTVYTNATVAVQAVIGGNPDSVELLKNNTVLATLPSPYGFSWNTSSEPEASYELKIRLKRGTEILESSPQTVVVDRTPPTLTSRQPVTPNTNVYLADEISLTASEALLPSSVSASTVFLKKGTTTLEDVPVQVSLENQNKILLRPTVLPPLPETFRTTLGAVTDLAGNTLQIPDTTSSAPDWQFVGNSKVGDGNLVDLSDQALALGADKQPVAAYLEEKGSNATIRVKRFDGTAWQEFGAGAGSAAANLLDAPLLVLDGNTPIVAWLEGSSGNKVINVKRWDGTAWQTLGNALNSSLTGASNLQLAISKTGTVVVSRAQLNLLLAATQWRVSFLNGSQWQSYGDAYTKPANSSEARLALDNTGQPALAFYVLAQTGNVLLRRFDGTTWIDSIAFTSPGGGLRPVRLAFDPQNNPTICVSQFQCYRKSNNTWTSLGNVSNQSFDFVLQLESGGTPVVASSLDPDFGVVVKRILPAGAVQINSVIDPADSPSSPNLVLDAQNNPYVLWEYSQAHEIHLRRANRIP